MKVGNYKNNELGHWIHGDGLVDPGHGYTNIHYEFVVIRTYVANEGGQLSCSPVTPSYNIHMLSQEHSFFEEHVHHVPMEWTT